MDLLRFSTISRPVSYFLAILTFQIVVFGNGINLVLCGHGGIVSGNGGSFAEAVSVAVALARFFLPLLAVPTVIGYGTTVVCYGNRIFSFPLQRVVR